MMNSRVPDNRRPDGPPSYSVSVRVNDTGIRRSRRAHGSLDDATRVALRLADRLGRRPCAALQARAVCTIRANNTLLEVRVLEGGLTSPTRSD